MSNLIDVIEKEGMRKDLPKLAIGDTVKVMETRPLSKDKRWRLVEVMEKVK